MVHRWQKRNHNLEIINEKLADVKAKAENLSKVNQHLDNQFEDFVYEANKNMESGKGNCFAKEV